AIREQIVSAIHLIVQLERLPDGSRRVSSVQEVQGIEGDTVLLQELYRRSGGVHGGTIEPTGLRPRFLESFSRHGVEVPVGSFAAPRAVRAEREAAGRRPPTSRAALIARER